MDLFLLKKDRINTQNSYFFIIKHSVKTRFLNGENPIYFPLKFRHFCK